MHDLRIYSLAILSLLLFGCAGQPTQQCPSGMQQLPGCPPANAINDEFINNLYTSRTWLPADELSFDPVKKAEDAKIPINNARTKVIGPTYDDALKSLAGKI